MNHPVLMLPEPQRATAFTTPAHPQPFAARRPCRPQYPPQHRCAPVPQPPVGGGRLSLLHHLLPHHLTQLGRQAPNLFLEPGPCGNPLFHEVFLPRSPSWRSLLTYLGEHLIYFPAPIPFCAMPPPSQIGKKLRPRPAPSPAPGRGIAPPGMNRDWRRLKGVVFESDDW